MKATKSNAMRNLKPAELRVLRCAEPKEVRNWLEMAVASVTTQGYVGTPGYTLRTFCSDCTPEHEAVMAAQEKCVKRDDKRGLFLAPPAVRTLRNEAIYGMRLEGAPNRDIMRLSGVSERSMSRILAKQEALHGNDESSWLDCR